MFISGRPKDARLLSRMLRPLPLALDHVTSLQDARNLLTQNHYDVILTDMQFDPFNPGRRFAAGLAGAFMTDDGVTWQRLLDTAALRGRPANCYYDWVTAPTDPALYVSFAGRSLVKITGFARTGAAASAVVASPVVASPAEPATNPTPTPLARVRTADGQVGTARAMPDNRVEVTLDDGRTIIVDEHELRPYR